MHSKQWLSVSKSDPCKICGHDTWCTRSHDDSAQICRREEHPGALAKADKNGNPFWLYKNDSVESKLVITTSPKRTVIAPKAESSVRDAVYTQMLAVMPLYKSHRDNLHFRGIPDHAIERNQYRSLTQANKEVVVSAMVQHFSDEVLLGTPGFYKTPSGRVRLAGGDGLVVPVRNHHKEIVAIKIRSNNANAAPKYTYLSSTKFGGPSADACVHVPLFEAGRIDTIRVTEGELKADTATELTGILTVSIPGVGCWNAINPILPVYMPSVIRVAFDSLSDFTNLTTWISPHLTTRQGGWRTEGTHVSFHHPRRQSIVSWRPAYLAP